MAVKDKTAQTVRVSPPKIKPLPETENSRPVCLEPYHVDLLPAYDYVSREYLISGTAAGESYCTRILLRCPRDAASFSGFAVEEPSHLWGGTSIWRATNRWLMRNGHAWLEVDSQAPSALGNVKAADPVRYGEMHFIPGPLSGEFKENIPFVTEVTKEALSDAYDTFKAQWWPATTQSPEIIAAASWALRSGALGIAATRVVLSGLSQTGGLTRRFVTHSARHLRLPDGNVPFEGYVPCQSGGDALPDVPGVKIVEIVGESEFQGVRLPCGVGGQLKGLAHRRPESDSFRLYEVAGMAHRESRYPSDLDLERYAGIDLREARWSTFANSFVYHAVFEAVEKWICDDVPPPTSCILQTVGNSDEIARDELGNAEGGVRTVHTNVPLARFVAATPKGRPNWYWGSEVPFSEDKLRSMYRTVCNYRQKAGRAMVDQMHAGFLLPADAETLRRETIESVAF